MKNVLVIGGAGYIGSHMCKYLFDSGYHPIVLDNLSQGHRGAVQWGPLIQGKMEDRQLLANVYQEYRIDAVMHFAALINVGDSVSDPIAYYTNNVCATINLLQSMVEAEVRHFMFSSTCAIYGDPVEIPIDETHPRNPINPYGRTKLMVEQILADFRQAYGIESTVLRYFNAAGADPDGTIGEDHRPETHLIPLVIQCALGKREKIQMFGDDYPTSDGTCIRDYIHVNDLCQAHLLALKRLLDGRSGAGYNLGNGTGYSVKEVIDTVQKITGKKILSEIIDRRDGDPAILIGSSDKAISELGWAPEFTDLETIIKHAWNWHRHHPDGYK